MAPTIEDLQKQIADLQAQIAQLEKTSTDKDGQIAELNKAKTALEGDVVALKADSDGKQAKITELEGNLKATMDKLPVITEILAANPAVKQETLFSMSKEQLTELKPTLSQKVADNSASPQGKSAASPTESEAPTLTLSEYARQKFGKIDVPAGL